MKYYLVVEYSAVTKGDCRRVIERYELYDDANTVLDALNAVNYSNKSYGIISSVGVADSYDWELY